MGVQARTVDQIIAALASRAYGIVTRVELLAAGVTAKEIERRLARGSLLPVLPGVYRVGRVAPSVAADYLAAVRAGGDGAVLSGRAAGHHWDVLRGPPPTAEVTARTERRIKGVRTRRCRNLDPRECTVWRGIPVTTIARTLVDLAAVLDEEELARAFHAVSVRYRTTPEDVEQALARRPRAKGVPALRRVVRGDTPVLLSRMERDFHRFLKRHGFPLPETNRHVDGRYVDCRWPRYKLTVELDGYRYHSTRHAWELDHKREREAYARGDAFRRYTWADVHEDPLAMHRELKVLFSTPVS